MNEKKAITLTLTEWQQRMLADYMKKPVLVKKVTIPFIDSLHWRTYRMPEPIEVAKGAWNLYLTKAQIARVAKLMGAEIPISAVLISPEMEKEGKIVFG
jgi:hypothetical protein